MKNLIVRSVVIDWPSETMEITTMADNKHTIPLDTTINVRMIGFQSEEQQSMTARELGQYMSQGYVILRIDFEE